MRKFNAYANSLLLKGTEWAGMFWGDTKGEMALRYDSLSDSAAQGLDRARLSTDH